MVKSTGFRLASILIPTLLLLVLAGVVYLALRDNPVTPFPATLRTPVATPGTADITPTPGARVFLVSAMEPVRLDGTLRYTEADIAFGPPQGYLLDLAEQAAILTARDDSPAAGTILVLRNEDPAAYAQAGEETSLQDTSVFDAFVRFYAAQDDFTLGESAALTIGGQPGWAIDLVSQDAGDYGGRIALTRPAPDRLFVMIGVGPTEVWRGQGLADYMAILETVTFLDLAPNGAVVAAEPSPTATAAPATSTPTPPPTAPATVPPTPTETPPIETPTPETPTPEPPTPEPPTPEPPTPETPEESDLNGTVVDIPAADTPQPKPTPMPEPEQLTLDPTRWTPATNGNFVNRLAVREETLWAATTGGAVAWNLTSGHHAKFTTADGLAGNHLTTVANCDLPNFGIVLGGDRGLQVYAPEDGNWRTHSVQSGELTADDVIDIYCDAQAGYLVVLYPRAGIDVYDANTQSWTHLALDVAALEDEVGHLRRITGVESGNALWVAAQRGLVWIQGDFGATNAPEELTVVVFTPENSPLLNESITALSPAGADVIWLASNGAVYRTDGAEWETFTPETITGPEFPHGRINGLAVDANNLLWIASDQTNICRFDPAEVRCVEFFVNQPGMVQGPLSSLTLDSQGRPYYGALGNGVSGLNGDGWRSLVIENQLSMGNTVRGFALDGEGGLWIAANSGATQVDPRTLEQPVHYTPSNSPLPFADITVVGAGAQDQDVWFGANGAANFNGADWAVFDADDNLAAAPIQAIAADGVGRTWLGSQGAGISIWTGSNFFNLTAANGLPSEDITALASAGDVIWIGTRGGGLLRFQNNQLRFFGTRDTALPSNTITALAVHPRGGLLIGTDRGLAHYADDTMSVVTQLPPGVVTALAVPTPWGETDTGTDVWVVLDGSALYFFDGEDFASGVFYQIQPVPAWSPAPMTALILDTTGVLWVGFQRGGMARYTP